MSVLKYGLTLEDIKSVDSKIEKQKKFLSEFVIDIFDKEFNLLDTSMSANINPKKYFAEVNNRVNSLFQYSKSLGFYPIFMTITLPDRFHPSSKKYNPDLSVKDGVRYLSQSWAKFLRLKIFKNIREATGHNMIYIRVLEPHKSGVSHAHVMMFLPKNFILPVKKVFKRHFSADGASRNAHASAFKYAWNNSSGGAVAYLLKYINKTFKNALEDRMTLEAYYFAHHRIIRFTTSRTLIPLNIHRKIRYDENFRDFIFTTHLYKSNMLYSCFDNTQIHLFHDPDLPDKVLYSRSPLLDRLFKKSISKKPEKITRHKSLKPVPLIIDNHQFFYHLGRILTPSRSVSDLSDFELYSEFKSYDVDTMNFDRFINIRNECVKRGLIESHPVLKDQIFGFEDYKSIVTF